MPADMNRYPLGWDDFSIEIRFDRAGGRCECTGECGLHRNHDLYHEASRRCFERHGLRAAYAKGVVVLTVAHLCACDPPCMIPEHVKAMCQRCHLRTDQKLHVQHRHRNKRLKAEQAGQLTLKV